MREAYNVRMQVACWGDGVDYSDVVLCFDDVDVSLGRDAIHSVW